MSTMPLPIASSHPSDESSRLARALASVARRMSAARERWIIREHLRDLRELDEYLLRDIGASGDEIYRVYKLRNGDRPTLVVG